MRIFTTLACCLFAIAATYGQSRWAAGIETQVGLSGENQSHLHENSFGTSRWERTESTTRSAAAGAGLWLRYRATRNLNLRMGVNYLNNGHHEEELSYTENLTTGVKSLSHENSTDLRIHQLQVPLELEFEFGTGKYRPYLSAGVQAGMEWLDPIFQETKNSRFEKSGRHWNVENSTLEEEQSSRYLRAVTSIGLHVDDRLSVSLRHTWSGQRSASWREDGYAHSYENIPEGVIICFAEPAYGITSRHRRVTSLQFSYRIF